MKIAQRIQRPLGLLAVAGMLAATPFALMAQNGYPQPYNNQDPNNYSSPASQAYQQQYPMQNQQYQNQQQQFPPQNQDGYDDQGPPLDAVQQAPPPLPDYDQPAAEEDGQIWTPGYWAYGSGGYSWVDGAWVEPPYVGALWTPGYWGSGPYGYFWNTGYWGNSIGYYGGINYGFGYFGTGFYGGYWNGGRFFYNRAYGHFGFRGGSFYNQPYAGSYGRIRGAGLSFTAINHGYAPGFHGERGGTFNRQGAEFRGRAFTDGARNNNGQPGNNGAFNNRYQANPAQGVYNRNPGATQSQMQRPAQTTQGQGNYGGRSFGGAYGNQVRQQPSAPSTQQNQRSAPAAPRGGGGARTSSPRGGGGGAQGSHGGGHR